MRAIRKTAAAASFRGEADDTLLGTVDSDLLSGQAGDDVLDGGAGADILAGGTGNDTYVVDDPADEVRERPGEGDADLVRASVSYALPGNVENLTLLGEAGLGGTGNNLANLIIGNAGANLLAGGAGNDTLDGDAGADTLLGGLGNDSFIVDSAGDLVVERAGEGNADSVAAWIGYTLPAYVEWLTLLGTADIAGTGNALNNLITGNAGANLLQGGLGNDSMDGGTGADTLMGGAGNDVYVVDGAEDDVWEYAGEGVDTLIASVSRMLGENFENLTLTGTEALGGIGNSLANVITGNAGDNMLYGGVGRDTLNGGDGNDILLGSAGADLLAGGAGTDYFVLEKLADSRAGSARDTIADFSLADDYLDLTALTGGLPITYLGTAAFPAAGSSGPAARLQLQGADAILQLDLPGGGGTGDGVPDAEIMLLNLQALKLSSILGAIAPTAPRTIYIDPTATEPGDGSVEFPFASWYGFTLQAGNTYLQKAGTEIDGSLVLRGTGTEALPITIGTYGGDAAVTIHGSLVLDGSTHMALGGFTIEGSEHAGIIVHGGSSHISITGNTILDTTIGVWFGSDSGGGNLVRDNLILDSVYYGINISQTDHSDDPTRIIGNIVRGSGSHGMEVNASGIVIEGNEVSDNGRAMSGSSGIHVFGGIGAADGFGFDNVIRGNTVFNNHEASTGYDGNGIQLDQFTGRNLVADNIVYGNDGAGIVLYDSYDNLVTGNTVHGNALDRTNTHALRGEIILAGSPEPGCDLTDRNTISGNVITVKDAAVSAFWVDAMTAEKDNVFGGNTVTREAAGAPVYTWAGTFGTIGADAALWNGTLAAGGGDDIWL